LRYSTRVTLFINRFNRQYRVARDRGLYQVSALIRLEARESMRRGKGPSKKGTPPRAHRRAGLKEINFHVYEGSSIIGPRKFPRSNMFNRTVPNIHEKGGMAIPISFRRRKEKNRLYPERSFMWNAVKKLKQKGKIQSRFNVTLRSSW